MRLFSVTVAICVLAGAILQTASAQPRASLGFRDTSCGKWTAERKNQSSYAKALEYWTGGFLSGSNFSRPSGDFLSGVDRDAINGWLDNYCQRNPLVPFQDAVGALANELAQRANR